MTATRASSRAATAIAVVLAILAGVAAAITTGVAWGRSTMIDTPGYISAVARPLIEDPAAKDALAADLTDRTLGALDLDAGLVDVVPFEYRVLAHRFGDQIVRELESRLRPAIRAQLDAPDVERVWERTMAEAHAQLVDLLGRSGSGQLVTIDLQPVLAGALHDVGVAIQQRFPELTFVTAMFDGIADALPDDAGTVPIDVSRVDGFTRALIGHDEAVLVGAALVALLSAVGAIALAGRRRGAVVTVLGITTVLGACVLYGLVAWSLHDAGAALAARRPPGFSPDLQTVVDIQAGLVVASLRPWVAGLAVAGLLLIGLGAVLLVRASGQPSAAIEGPDRTPSPVGAPSTWQLPEEPPYR